MPPSRTEKGGSSQMARSISKRRSSRASMAAMSRSSRQVKGCSSSLSRGRAAAQSARVLRSRPPAVPYTARPTRRCMSPISRRVPMSSPRVTLSRVSSSTAARRRRMATAESRGRSTQARSRRPPMGVFVRSSTHSRLPFFSPLRRDSVSSRLRLVVQSSSIYRPPKNTSRRLIWLRSNFWVRMR